MSDLLISLRKAVTEGSQKRSPHNLSLNLSPARVGNHYYQSVLAPVAPCPALSALRNACAQAFGVVGHSYFPHLSLLYGDLADEERERIAHQVNGQGNERRQSIKVDRIAVVRVQGLIEDWMEVASLSI